MKTILLGGPDNGKIVLTDPHQFGYGIYTETLDKNTNKQLSMVGYNYTKAGSYSARHPCKKKGTLDVYVFTGEECKKPTDQQIEDALKQAPPEANVYRWLSP